MFTPVHRCMGIQPSTLWVVGSYPPESVQPYPFKLPTIVCHTARPYLFPFHHILRDSFGIPSGWCGNKVGRLLGGCWEDVGRMLGGCWEDDGRMIGGEWEENGRNPQKFLMQSGRISVQPTQDVVSADSRCGISRLKKCYQPTQEVLPADQMNTACRLKKTGSSGIPSDVILMHDVSMLTSLPRCSAVLFTDCSFTPWVGWRASSTVFPNDMHIPTNFYCPGWSGQCAP